MNEAMLEGISHHEFDKAIGQYISWVSEWDGALPADVFFGVWADLQERATPVELRARIVEGRLLLISTSESPVRAQGNRIYLENGQELVIQLETAP